MITEPTRKGAPLDLVLTKNWQQMGKSEAALAAVTMR